MLFSAGPAQKERAHLPRLLPQSQRRTLAQGQGDLPYMTTHREMELGSEPGTPASQSLWLASPAGQGSYSPEKEKSISLRGHRASELINSGPRGAPEPAAYGKDTALSRFRIDRRHRDGDRLKRTATWREAGPRSGVRGKARPHPERAGSSGSHVSGRFYSLRARSRPATHFPGLTNTWARVGSASVGLQSPLRMSTTQPSFPAGPERPAKGRAL